MYEDICNKLANLYEELQGEYNTLIEQAMVQVKMSQLPSEQWLAFKQDLTDNNKMKLDEFKKQFPKILLDFLQRINEQIYGNHPLYNIHQMQHTGDLLQKSLFKVENETIQRHQILVDLVQAINQNIKLFFFNKRDILEDLLQKRQLFNNKVKSTNNQTIKIDKNAQNKLAYIDLESCVPLMKEANSEQFNKIIKQKQYDLPQDFSKCLCNQLIKAALHPTKVVECLMCRLHFHQHCIKAQQTDLTCLVCPYCTIIHLDMFNPVIEILSLPTFFQLQQPLPQKNFQFYIPEQHKTQMLQFRCLRVDDNHGLDEITWPDYGEVLVNGTKIYDFKPLPQNTSLKKRKDNVIVLKEKINVHGQANFITLKETRPSYQEISQLRVLSGQTYMAGVFVVLNISPERLINQIKKNHSLWLSVNQGKEFIRQLQAQIEGVEFQSIKISVACPFTTKRIETPARGNLCKHGQCFSLESMVQLTFTSGHRKWRCPICKRKCFKIQLDQYQLSIIAQMKHQGIRDNDITFKENVENVFIIQGRSRSFSFQQQHHYR